MSVGAVVVALLIAAWIGYCIWHAVKKKGSCGCESGDCSHCSGCSTKVYGINTGPGIDEPQQCSHCKH